MKTENRQIEYWLIERLKPYTQNARTHSRAQIMSLARSLEQFGWRNPILIGEDGEIIAGHGRVMAAEFLGWDKAPVIVMDDMSRNDRRAYRLADNKLAELAAWDMGLLYEELDALQAEQYNLGALGFDGDELDSILAPVGADMDDDDAGNEHGAAGPPTVCPACGHEF